MRMHMRLLLGLVDRALRSRDDLPMENLVLRQQLAVYARFTCSWCGLKR